MSTVKSGIVPALILLIIVSTVGGLFAAYKRFHVEASNRRIEIALEWQEILTLAQASVKPVPVVLDYVKQQHVTTVVIAEDTITTLEQAGAVHPVRTALSPNPMDAGKSVTIVVVDSEFDIGRIWTALALRGFPPSILSGAPPEGTKTVFEWTQPFRPGQLPGGSAMPPRSVHLGVTVDYIGLRTMGLGLPQEAVATVRATGLDIAGRIGNFPGVTAGTAQSALVNLHEQGATTVIFNGEEVLGYRGLEKEVAEIFKESKGKAPTTPQPDGKPPSTVLTYGAVEFGKQKGDEKLSNALKGEYVRVHSIQAAEMGQMEEDEAVDRFVRAGKERNIRFCYIRLVSFAGPDPLGTNGKFLSKIAKGLADGNIATGGGMGFGPARRFLETGVPPLIFALIALGAAAGAVWLIHSLAALPIRLEAALLVILCIACAAAALLLGETGRKLVAFLAGVVYPATACLLAYPGRRGPEAGGIGNASTPAKPLSPMASLTTALRQLCVASLITALGIVQVIGLLASRPFMVHASQFLGIKAQHAVPVLIIAVVAIAGGVLSGETWGRFVSRAQLKLAEAMREPARFGMLLLGIIALAGFLLVVARTGNDSGVGVSSIELAVRNKLDRILPVRPRTKEFLVGHPAFVLALAWWWRGRRRLAIPAFVVGSLGQVSLLNTFCHIHTPLMISVWRDGLGLLFGALLGAVLFLGLEALFAASARTAKNRPLADPIRTPADPDRRARK